MITILLTVGCAAVFVAGNYTAYRTGVRYGHARGVADEKKRATLAKLGGKAEWHFRVAANGQYSSSSAVVYALAPDGSEYVCNEYLQGINSINGDWISVESGEELSATEGNTLTNRFFAWRALQRTGARS